MTTSRRCPVWSGTYNVGDGTAYRAIKSIEAEGLIAMRPGLAPVVVAARRRNALRGLGGLRELHRFGFAANDLPSLAWVAVMRGREPELIELVERESFVSPWLRATASVLARDFRAAAEIFAGMESPAHEAFYRLRGRGAAGRGGPSRGGRRAAAAGAGVLPVGWGDAVRARGRSAARRQCLAACALRNDRERRGAR